MADQTVVRTTGKSAEEVALELHHRDVRIAEDKPGSEGVGRAYILDLYQECFRAVRLSPRGSQ